MRPFHASDQFRFLLSIATLLAVAEELADVFICALSFSNRAGIDIADAVRKKLAKNAKKYPVAKYKGRY